MPSPRLSSQPRDGTQVSLIAGRFFTLWAIREAWWKGSSTLLAGDCQAALFWAIQDTQEVPKSKAPKGSLPLEFRSFSLLVLSPLPHTQVGKLLAKPSQSQVELAVSTQGGKEVSVRRLWVSGENHLGMGLWFKYFRNWLGFRALTWESCCSPFYVVLWGKYIF